MPARRRKPLARDLPAELQVAATNGSILTDSRGRKYIDFLMGWCVANFGGRPEPIMKAIESFKGADYVYPGYSYAPWTELARLLASLAPRPLTTCFRATGGSEAVDLALQAAMIHTGRRAFLSLEDSYHGNSLAALSIGAPDSRERIKNLLPHCGKIAPALDAKALHRIEQRLKWRDVAAFVMEPISINLGVLIPEKDAIRGVRDLCRRYVRYSSPMKSRADSAGRTGRAFACEHFDLARPAAVRIQGLAIGIDVGDEDYADAIRHRCHRNGLLVSTEGSTVLLPSLAIDKRTAARGLDLVARSL